MGNKEIEHLKEYRHFMRQADKDSKQEKCLLCEEPYDSFCNSHIIPQFVLNNISANGYLYRGIDAFKVSNNNPIYKEKGVNNTWTFRVICKDCDKRYFADYESEQALLALPTTRVMAEIALKSVMMQIAKRYHEIASYNLMKDNIRDKYLLDEEKELDLRDYWYDFRRFKKIIDKNLKTGFTLLYYKVLNYVTPFAMQGPIAVHRDFDGEIVNDVNDFNHDIRMQQLYCGVFPLKEKTVVIVYHHRDDINYKKFDRKFLKLDDEQKLKYLNYLIFKYCEHYAISPNIKSEILSNSKLIQLSKENNDSPNHFLSIEDILCGNNELVNWRDIPNLLAEKNKLR